MSRGIRRAAREGAAMFKRLRSWLEEQKVQREEALHLLQHARGDAHRHEHEHPDDGVRHSHDHGHGDHEHDHAHPDPHDQ